MTELEKASFPSQNSEDLPKEVQITERQRLESEVPDGGYGYVVVLCLAALNMGKSSLFYPLPSSKCTNSNLGSEHGLQRFPFLLCRQ